MGKLLVIAAPSGAGKTTIVRYLLRVFDNLAFSVSATTRPRRENETEGMDYYFISVEKFKELVAEDAFLEWEEVYAQQFYGTLKAEVERLWALGKTVIFDVDVQGALRLKEKFPESTLAIFIKPPSEEILIQRLKNRRSESEESLKKRIGKATLELQFEKYFDLSIVNDDLEKALSEAENITRHWLDTSVNASEFVALYVKKKL